MKKRLGILFALLLLVACSKSDETEPIPATYGITIEKTCKGSQTTYCISKATYDYLKALPFTGEVCKWVSVSDIEGKSISGYVRSFGSPCNK